jgi:hypothetical protein
VTTHGTHHLRVIGQTGARVTIERRGYNYWRGRMDAKGWTAPRQVGFLDDLRAGRMLADLDRAALLPRMAFPEAVMPPLSGQSERGIR